MVSLASPSIPSSSLLTVPVSGSKFSNNRGAPPPFKFRISCGLQNGACDLKLVLHDALDSSGVDTTHARAAREGFCSQIKTLSDIERETSITINRKVDLGRIALHIAAEDDSLVSHSSVPLPVDSFIERLDDLSMGYCSQYSFALKSSPEDFLGSLERYLYEDKGFKRTNVAYSLDPRVLYLHTVLTHRSGSAVMLSLIYSEILKMIRLWNLLDYDIEIFYPHDLHSLPRGYPKQKSRESDQLHIMTSHSLLLEMLRNLKEAFWPFQHDNAKSLFLKAAHAANCFDKTNSDEQSGFELASAKAAQHRLERGVWTSVRLGDMRRALSACERLILLGTDVKELRDYGILLYHCGLYKEAMEFFILYEDTKDSSTLKQSSYSVGNLEDAAVEKLMTRLKFILMEEGWGRPSDGRNFLSNNSDPWDENQVTASLGKETSWIHSRRERNHRKELTGPDSEIMPRA